MNIFLNSFQKVFLYTLLHLSYSPGTNYIVPGFLKEFNEIIKTAYYDYVTVRRFLIEYGFLDRKPDGSQYWLK